jgi:hypothetical protein
VGPKGGLNAVEKEKISCFCRESNPGRPFRSLIAIPTELTRLPGFLAKQGEKYLELLGRRYQEAKENHIKRSFITPTLHQMLL